MLKEQTQDGQLQLLDFEPKTDTFYDDVVKGLELRPRSLPSKYFYDAVGSKLFDEICELDEYYLTRTELSIMQRYADEMAYQIGRDAMLVEYGSGSSIKTRILLDHLLSPSAYAPVDISRSHLHSSAARLAELYPKIEILPVCADFTEPFDLPTPTRDASHSAVYFPGSTIGNFLPTAAKAILAQIVDVCGHGGGLLIGIDLQKETRVLEDAYNDSRGVTAAFNLNLLHRINRELDANICVDQFQHRAAYSSAHGRIETDIISLVDQTIEIGDREFEFEAGEAIRTEYSHKYTIDGFATLAKDVGLTLRKSWTDDDERFAVLHLVVAE